MENEKKFDVYCLGLRQELFADFGPGEESFDEDDPIVNGQDILLCKSNYFFFTITLSTSYGWCGSGYTTASWGCMGISDCHMKREEFGPISHYTNDKKPLLMTGIYSKYDEKGFALYDSETDSKFDHTINEFDNNVFHYSADDDDVYYPRGAAYAHMTVFERTGRRMEKMPLYIFHGESGLGKSTMALPFRKNKIVVETDSFENGEMPDTIWGDIIVIGNKWKNVTMEEVIKRIPLKDEINIIPVQFGI